MSEQNPVSEAADKVDDIIPDPVTETAEDPVPNEIRPPWVDEIIEKVEDLTDKVAGVSEHDETVAESHTEGADHLHEETDRSDESPSKGPWTHRPLFGGSN